jgi:HK97 family phage portal protein
MSLISRLLNKRGRVSKFVYKAAAEVDWVPIWVRHGFLRPIFRSLVAEGMKSNGVVFACISALAMGYQEPPLVAYRYGVGGKADEPLSRSHPLQRLLSRPNAQMSCTELSRQSMTFRAISGNAYYFKVRGPGGLVTELIPYHDGHITPIQGRGPLVDHYEYQDEATGQIRRIAVEDIVHLQWMPDPERPWTGMGPIQAVAREVQTDAEARSYAFSLLKNNAVPSILIKMPKDRILNDEEFARQREQWRETYSGENRGGVGILEGGAEVEVLGMRLDQLGQEALSRISETRICSAMRVPAIVAGVDAGLQRSTFANYREAMEAFADTLVQFWHADAKELTMELCPEFGLSEDYYIDYDLTRVSAFLERQHRQRVWAVEAAKEGIIKRNEARILCGLEPDEVMGDRYLLHNSDGSEPEMLPAPTEKEDAQKRLRAALTLGAAMGRMAEHKALLSAEIDEDDVDLAMRYWDEVMGPGYAGLLDAGVEDEAEEAAP